MQQTFQFHADPGHGWLEVHKHMLEVLGIASKISSFSYQCGSTVYLEEDCDYAVFYDAYLKKTGCAPVLEEHYSERRSNIRSYARYMCDSEVFSVVASVHDPRTDEGAFASMKANFGSLQDAVDQAKSWSRNGYWSAVYAKESGEVLHDFAPQ